MLRFIFRRLLSLIPVLLIIVTLTFVMVKLTPGGPFSKEKKVPPEVLAQLEAHYGMDKPLWQQYLNYLADAAQGNLGPSYKYMNRSVNELIGASFPVSLELGCWALMVALILGVTAGLIASRKPNSSQDYVPMSLSMIGICAPTFVMGPLLAGVFALWLQWYNSSGWDFPQDRVLPALTLGIYYAAYFARLTRGGMLEILNQDFIRTARAKGASTSRIIWRHALKGGLAPVVSFSGPAIAGLVTGSFVVETVFDIPGLGKLFIMSVSNRDTTMILGTVLFYATLIVVMNLVVDVVQAWLNPKLRLS